ncbi:MAG: ATP-dependent DNA helicase RecG [Candidatus Margulisiibacteriota bacterium]|jgi:ATP-dependent DNA helicase RecG
MHTKIQYVKGVGPIIAEQLNKLNIFSIHDFFYNFPRTYSDRRNLPKISELKNQEVQSIVAKIVSVNEAAINNKAKILKVLLSDRTGHIQGIWFNQNQLKKYFIPNKYLFVKGKVEWSLFNHQPQLIVSEFEFIDQRNFDSLTGKVLPIYSLTNGLTQFKMRDIAFEIFTNHTEKIIDYLPQFIQEKNQLLDLPSALKGLHFPESGIHYQKARHRIVFDEFFYLQIELMTRRVNHFRFVKGPIFKTKGPLVDHYFANLPYQLTAAQTKAIEDVKKDVTSGFAMNRLIQGDVGSGKTDVAILSLLFALESGKKGAIMAPTEILAQQLYLKFKNYLDALEIPTLLLKGQVKGKNREKILIDLKKPMPLIIVGTHALLEDDVLISDLGLMIIDEQHRFGVMQRLALQKKGVNPHCLYMTATPIPRSLTLTFFGDLFKTVINELPANRIPAKTYLVKNVQLPKIYGFFKKELQAKSQIYIVYPLVEESEKLDLKNAIDGFEEIKLLFPGYTIGLLHGRLKPQEKEEIMRKFKQHEINILVSTTVIEVGIDVPTANIMLIHDAERFGLAQLHQLRGRIGRGGKASYCFLLSIPKSQNAKKRIAAMLKTTDGFKIAEFDLKIRGPGDLLGTKQAGLPEFKLADLIKDEKILLQARSLAKEIIMKDPDLNSNEVALLKEYLKIKNDLSLKIKLN